MILVTLRDAPLPALVALVSGTAAAGLIQFALRVALTIASLDEVVARIAYPAFSRLQGFPDRQARAVAAAVMMTSLILVPAQCLLAALAPVIVPLVFGARWGDAILPLQLISLATLLRYPARYLRQAEFARGDARLALAMTALTTFLALGCFAAGLLLGGLPGSATGFALSALLGLLGSAWLAGRTLTVGWRPFALALGAGIVAAAAGRMVLLLTAAATMDPAAAWVSAVVAGGVFTGVFGVLLLLTNRQMLAMGIRLAGRSVGRQGQPGRG